MPFFYDNERDFTYKNASRVLGVPLSSSCGKDHVIERVQYYLECWTAVNGRFRELGKWSAMAQIDSSILNGAIAPSWS